MKQARKSEEKYTESIKEDEWNLLNKETNQFAESNEIEGLKNNVSGHGIIIVFMTIYIVLILWALFNILCRCN